MSENIKDAKILIHQLINVIIMSETEKELHLIEYNACIKDKRDFSEELIKYASSILSNIKRMGNSENFLELFLYIKYIEDCILFKDVMHKIVPKEKELEMYKMFSKIIKVASEGESFALRAFGVNTFNELINKLCRPEHHGFFYSFLTTKIETAPSDTLDLDFIE